MTNLEHWKTYGDSLLAVQPFMDSVIVRGEGCYLVDADGRRILDLAAGQFCSILGHSHPKFIRRLQEQLSDGLHLGDQYVSPNVLRATARLGEVMPGEHHKAIILSTGSEANECAMRIAKTVTGRSGMLAYTRGYYGISLATRTLSSISDQPGKVDFEPAPINQHKLLTPTCGRCPLGLTHPSCNTACLESSLEMLGHRLGNVAGVIVESVISAGGMIFPPKDYIQSLHARTKAAGALFIVDEAQTGFGRCGSWFDIQHYDVEPDVIVVSKTAGNGYPAAAVVVSQEVAGRLEDSNFMHLSSHQNDPLAAAAILAVIDIVDEEGLVENSRVVGSYFLERLRSLQATHPVISDVRGRGLMIGLELSNDVDPHLAFRLAMLCEQRGLHITFTYFEPVIRFIPPLILSKDDVDRATAILDECLPLAAKGSESIAQLAPQNERSGPLVRRMMQPSFDPVRAVRRMWRTSPEQWVEKLRKSF